MPGSPQEHNDSKSSYNLAPSPRTPNLPGAVIVSESADEVIDEAATLLLTHSINCVRALGDFHLALGAGPILSPLYMRLMYDPTYRAIPWTRTHLWQAHEHIRPGSNDRLFDGIHETIVEHSGIPETQTHPMPIDDPNIARIYTNEMREALAWREKGHDRPDCIIVALNEDASLGGLPNTLASQKNTDPNTLVSLHNAADPNERTVSLSISTFNAARLIIILAVGERLRDAVRQIEDASNNQHTTSQLPAAQIKPNAGEAHWRIDQNACPSTRD